jgi:hypothetical protein
MTSNVIPILEKNKVASKLIVPPGGFAGFAQQTAATQELFRRAGRLGGKTTQRRRRKAKATGRKKKAVRASKRTKRSTRPARLVKGSAAAKRYMASIRRKRRK